MLARNLLWIVLTVVISLACYQKTQWNRYASTLSEAMTLIERHYVEPVQQRQLFEDAMQGMASGLDAYSGYIEPREYDEFQEVLDQQFGGIGVMVELHPRTRQLTIISPIIDTPASRAGLRAGDVILAIDGEEAVDLEINDAVQRIHGPVGSKLTLRIQHVGESTPIDVELERAEIRTDSVLGDVRRADGSWDFYLEEDPRILYLRITSFGERTADEVQAALRSRNSRGRGPSAVLIDLRDNAGGLLNSAVAVCDMLLEEGVIVSTRGRGGVESRRYSARPDLELAREIPVAVLVNRFSASSSEIVAACLQDHQRAVIVGERTWGKGTIQNIIPLEAGKSALKLTTASYWRPSNRNIHRTKDAPESADWGVSADPGLQVSIPETDLRKVLQYRRYRDVHHAPPAAAPNDSSSTQPASDAASADAPTADEESPVPFDDPQLRKALVWLHGKLGESADSADSRP
ncbi:MAG: S41 family peptidase [Pirellulales bacterium]